MGKQYLREDFPSDIHGSSLEETLTNHEETRDAINREFTETVTMSKALIERMELDEPQLKPVEEFKGGEEKQRPIHPLEECISRLNSQKKTWDDAWEHRKQTLHHWQSLGDFEYQVLAVSPNTLS